MFSIVAIVLLFLPLADLKTGSEGCSQCGEIRVCYGGETDLTAEDALCIIDKKCDTRYRTDACGVCDIDAKKNESRLMDCTGQCFEEEEMASMLELDACGDCGGEGARCDPQVRTAVPVFLPNNQKVVLTLTGSGFQTPEVQILVLPPEPPYRVLQKARVSSIGSGSNMVAEITGLAKGTYKIGARTGTSGTEYETKTGASVEVYATSDFTVDTISPVGVDLDGTVSRLNVTLHVSAGEEDLTPFEETITCLKGSERIKTTFSRSDSTLMCEVAVPETAMAYDVCVSLNGIHSIGCRRLPFYAPAPVVLHNTSIKFSAKADQLVLTFDVVVVAQDTTDCATFFEITPEFGRGSECTWSSDGTQLTVTIGEGATLGPDSTLTLRPGFRAADAAFARTTEAINLTTLATDVSPIRVRPLGVWPESLTSYAKNPVTLAIYVDYAPGGWAPESILWTVNGETIGNIPSDGRQGSNDEIKENIPSDGRQGSNDEIKGKGTNGLAQSIDFSNVGAYNVSVTVTDVFGGQAVVKQTITKLQFMLPDVVFRAVSGLKVRPDNSLETRPNTRFVIGAKISFVENYYTSLANFTFQWSKDGVDVGEGFFYRSGKTEISTDLCDNSVVFKLRVYKISDPDESIENVIVLHVKCRNPVAVITGGPRVDVPLDKALRVNIDGGTLSRDPDGGTLAYSWSCAVQIYSTRRDCIRDFRLTSKTSESRLSFSNKEFGNIKSNTDKFHEFTLTVSVTKNNRTLTSSAKVSYVPRDTKIPWVRWITIEHEYRSNLPIMIKAFVGPTVEAEWRFVSGRSEYGWVDLSSSDVRQKEAMVDGYASYIIKPDTLTPGQRYVMELQVTNTSTSTVTVSTFEIYIYRRLRLCTIQADTVTEMEETTLTLQGCVFDDHVLDDHVQSVYTSCMLGDREITLNEELKFVVPKFRNRQVTKTRFDCTITDNLGHVINVLSNEVDVILSSDIVQKTSNKVDELKKEGNLVDVIEVLTDNLEDTIEPDRESKQDKIVAEIEQLINRKPTIREIKRTLKSVNKFSMASIKKPEVTKSLADQIKTMLGTLCGEEVNNEADGLSNEDIKKHISTAKALALKERINGKTFRSIQNEIACIMFKRLAIGDNYTIVMDDGNDDINDLAGGNRTDPSTKYHYVMDTLENVRDKGIQIDFPASMYEVYRGQWGCYGSKYCHMVGLKLEEYITDPPDIQTGARFPNLQFKVVDLYNPKTGAKLQVQDLSPGSPITITFDSDNTGYNSVSGYYFSEEQAKWSDSGLTSVMEGGYTTVSTNHLSTFTLHGEPIVEKSLNLVLILGLSLGILLACTSTVILVRAFVIARSKMYVNDKEYNVEYDRTS